MFNTPFFSEADGYYALTTAGKILSVAVILILLIVAAFVKTLKTPGASKAAASTKTFSTKQLVFSAVCLALAYALSNVKLYHYPWGGSITLCSMLFVAIIGYWYGPKVSLLASFAYSLLQLMQDPWLLSPAQVFFDYILAFTALGVSGFFYGKKNGLIKGYIAAICLRGFFGTLAGYFFWMDTMPEDFPKSIAFLFPIFPNYGIVIGEGLITVLILLIPAVKKGIGEITRLAREN